MTRIINNLAEPAVLAVVGTILVPLIIAYYRKKRLFSEIGEGLSKSEAAFRADLIQRIETLQSQYEVVLTKLVECERQHAIAEVKIKQLELEVEKLEQEKQ